jgi:hypothetical protein
VSSSPLILLDPFGLIPPPPGAPGHVGGAEITGWPDALAPLRPKPFEDGKKEMKAALMAECAKLTGQAKKDCEDDVEEVMEAMDELKDDIDAAGGPGTFAVNSDLRYVPDVHDQ